MKRKTIEKFLLIGVISSGLLVLSCIVFERNILALYCLLFQYLFLIYQFIFYRRNSIQIKI